MPTEIIGHIVEPVKGAWQAWVLEQDSVWVNEEGDVILIDDIPLPYALNILRFVYRAHDDGFLEESPLVQAIIGRLVFGAKD